MGNSGRQKSRVVLTSALVALTMAFAPVYSVARDGAAKGTSAHPRLFGTNEFRSTKLEKFSKWNGVIARYESELTAQRQKCRVSRVNRCALERWQLIHPH